MFKELIPVLLASEKIGIFTHENPDGDAMGSAYSLKQMMILRGKSAEVFLAPTPDEAAYSLLKGKEETGLSIDECDLLVAVDSAEIKRLGEFSDVFSKHNNTIAIDHHITHINFAKVTVMEPVASCSEIMAKLYKTMGMEIPKDVADNLYMGMVCDTGNFKYSSVTPETMRIAAELMEHGADFAEISKRIFDTKTKEYYGLMQTALQKLKFFEDGKICGLYLSKEDFEKANQTESQAAGIVTLPGKIEGVSAGIYIRERGENEYKISLRSNDETDVSLVASKFGGGGHVRAAGCNAKDKSVDQILDEIVAEIKKQWKEDK